MKYINNKEKLSKFKKLSNYYIIIDFDHTLTTGNSNTSFGIIPKYIGGKCLEERTKIYEHYRPLELDYNMQLEQKQKIMQEWANRSFTLLSKYITEEVIDKSLENADIHLRDGAQEFLKQMYDNNIPVIIMSSGVGNLIKRFLEKQGVLYSNIKLVTNFFEIENEKAYIDMNNIMPTSKKDYKRIPLNIRNELNKIENAILIGDLVEDIKMVDEKQIYKTLTIGFLDDRIAENLKIYKENYDIVLSNNESFNTVKEILN